VNDNDVMCICVYFDCADIALYDPGKDFRCFDGLAVIPFAHVNDDYCDCMDGSDEPGKHSFQHLVLLSYISR